MAALISAYTGFVALSFLPPLVWLLFYLHEDRHPEPKRLLVLTFAAGILAAGITVGVELAIFGAPSADTPNIPCGFVCLVAPTLLKFLPFVLTGIAIIEEVLKYAAVRFSVLKRPELDEPVDAMIYMLTAALGFAAMENVLFLLPALHAGFLHGIELTASRFLGANLLHALSSAIVGYALARHLFSPWRRHAVFFGLLLASALHALFNYFIIIKDAVPGALVLVILLLVLMTIMVFVDFERLKQRDSRLKAGATNTG